MTKSLVTALAACLVFAGCGSVELAEPFDRAAASAALAPGVNQIHGSALIRQQGGGIVTCAGNPVFLMPMSRYALEWATALYGDASGGFRPADARAVKLKYAEGFLETARGETCDAQGAFQFTNVADGQYYLGTSVRWMASGAYGIGRPQGGHLLKAIAVKGGATKSIVLAP